MGADPIYGSQVRSLLCAVELIDVTVEGFLRLMSIPDVASILRPALDGLRQPLVESGSFSAERVDEAMAALEADEGGGAT